MMLTPTSENALAAPVVQGATGDAAVVAHRLASAPEDQQRRAEQAERAGAERAQRRDAPVA